MEELFNQLMAIGIKGAFIVAALGAVKMAGTALAVTGATIGKLVERGKQNAQGNPQLQDSAQNRVKRNMRAGLSEAGFSGRGLGARLNPKNYRPGRMRAKQSAIRNANQAQYGDQGMSALMMDKNKDDDKVMYNLAKYGSSGASQKAIMKKYSDDLAAADIKDASGNVIGRDQAKIAAAVQNRDANLAASATADMIGRTNANRRKALMQGATIGYGFKEGEAGWNDAMGIIDDISRDNPYLQRTMQNEFQYLAKGVGRADLSGNVEGNPEYNGHRAWSSVGLYNHGNGKTSAIQGSSQYYQELWDRANGSTDSKGRKFTATDIKTFSSQLTPTQIASAGGTEAAARQQAKIAVATFAREMGTIGQNASGGIRDEAFKQRQLLFEKDGNIQMLAEGGITSPNEAAREVARRARGYDPEEAQRQRLAQQP